ncbi:MAG: SDR family oxidoreductase, partial [Alphaproteobacteria bacterium]
MKLVVGAGGQIGRALLAAFAAGGISALGGTRREIDLAQPSSRWQIPGKVDQAFLFAAQTSMAACEQEPKLSARINVEALLELAALLRARGAGLVFLSTDRVFDGSRPHRLDAEDPCPTNAYGRQKAEAEAGLKALGGTTILRLSKVVPPDFPLFRGWLEALARGEPITPFADATLAPVSLGLVVEVLRRLASVEAGAGGDILQLSASREVTYAEAARSLAVLAGYDPALVRPTPAPPGAFLPFSTLDDTTLRAATGIAAPDPQPALETVAAAWRGGVTEGAGEPRRFRRYHQGRGSGHSLPGGKRR